MKLRGGDRAHRRVGYNTQHPLRERGEDLFACKLHNAIAEHFDGPPVEPGRYRVTWRPHDPVSQSFRSDAHPFSFERVARLAAQTARP